MLYSLSSTINNILISSSAACIDFACLNQLHITLGLLLVLNFIGVCKKSVIQHTCICEIEEEKRSCNDVHMYIYIPYRLVLGPTKRSEIHTKTANQRWQPRNGCNDVYRHKMAATFDFTTFFTQAFKATPFFHSLAVFVWIYILYIYIFSAPSTAQYIT